MPSILPSSHRAPIAIGLSCLLAVAFAQDLPELPPISDEPAPPLPELPSLPELPASPEAPAGGGGGGGALDELPPLPQAPLEPTLPSSDLLIPGSQGAGPLQDDNLLIPGDDLVPSPAVQSSRGGITTPSSDAFSDSDGVDNDGNGDPEFLDGQEEEDDDDDSVANDPFGNQSQLSFNGQARSEDTEGWGFGIRLLETYTSALSLGLGDGNDDGTLVTQISPSVSWRSAPEGAADYVVAAAYTPALSIYHSGSEGTTVDHDLDLRGTYDSEILQVQLSAGYLLLNAPNFFTGGFGRSIQKEIVAEANYAYSDRTQLNTNASFQDTRDDSGEFGQNQLFTWSIGALYEVSDRLQVGPNLRYAVNETEGFGEASSLGLALDSRFAYSDATNIDVGLGLERSEQDGGSDNVSPTANLSLRYRPSPIWQFRGTVRYETIPVTQVNNPVAQNNTVGGAGNLANQGGVDNNFLNGASVDGGSQFNASLGLSYSPTEDWRFNGNISRRTSPSFTNPGQSLINNAISLGANRLFGEATLSTSVAYSLTTFEGEVTAPPAGEPIRPGDNNEDQKFIQFAVFYTQPQFFRENLTFEAQFNYSETTGGISFDQTVASVGLGYVF